MKVVSKVLSLVAVLAMMSFIMPQKSEIIKIKTDTQCGNCEERIETVLNHTKGIKFGEVDVKTDMITVKFDPKKISKAEIKNLIASIGYPADDVKADPKALSELPKCCQPGGHD